MAKGRVLRPARVRFITMKTTVRLLHTCPTGCLTCRPTERRSLAKRDFSDLRELDRLRDFASSSFPILALSPSTNTSALPENLDQVVSGPVIDNIIHLFFDYVD